jgi:hypothetical protein
MFEIRQYQAFASSLTAEARFMSHYLFYVKVIRLDLSCLIIYLNLIPMSPYLDSIF